jgi:hypothetical protein
MTYYFTQNIWETCSAAKFTIKNWQKNGRIGSKIGCTDPKIGKIGRPNGLTMRFVYIYTNF